MLIRFFNWFLLQTLLRYAEDTEEGKKLLNLLSDVQANITVFVPHNDGFAANRVIVNTTKTIFSFQFFWCLLAF